MLAEHAQMHAGRCEKEVGNNDLARNIKESIYIRVNDPTLNNNIGKFNLPHIWDRVLPNTKCLNF